MTEKEAISIIKDVRPGCGEKPIHPEGELCEAFDMAIKALEEVQQYREMDRKLREVYGDCDGLLETAVDGFCKHSGVDVRNPIKARLLIDEDADKWDAYREIGTVEELKDFFVVISEDSENAGEDGLDLEIVKNLVELKCYRAIGTVEECREAREKQKPTRPTIGADFMVGTDDNGEPVWEHDYVCHECGLGITGEYMCCPSRLSKNYQGWIPVEERLPEDSYYILLSFDNFSLPMVGRYEESPEGGAFYLGDCVEEDTCISQSLVVNAWQPLPEPYRPQEKKDAAATGKTKQERSSNNE